MHEKMFEALLKRQVRLAQTKESILEEAAFERS